MLVSCRARRGLAHDTVGVAIVVDCQASNSQVRALLKQVSAVCEAYRTGESLTPNVMTCV